MGTTHIDSEQAQRENHTMTEPHTPQAIDYHRAQQSHHHACPRCFEPGPAYYRVASDEMYMVVCFVCAEIAESLELSVEPLH